MTANTYLHLGDLPASGRSVCHTLTNGTGWESVLFGDMEADRQAEFFAVGYTVDGATVYEPGLSVFAADTEESDGDDIVFCVENSDLDQVHEWIEERPAFLVSGALLPISGFDDEPLIQVAGVVSLAVVVRFEKRGRREGAIVVRAVATASV